MAFVSKKGSRYLLVQPQCADEKHNDLDTAPCFIVLSLKTKEGAKVDDIIGSLKWCIGSMLFNRDHLSYLRYEIRGNETTEQTKISSTSDQKNDAENQKLCIRYRSKSHSAASCLKKHIADNKDFGKLAEFKIEPYMYVSAPDFKQPEPTKNDVQVPAEPRMPKMTTEEEIKKE